MKDLEVKKVLDGIVDKIANETDQMIESVLQDAFVWGQGFMVMDKNGNIERISALEANDRANEILKYQAIKLD